MQATEQAMLLAEKSGNVVQLVDWLTSRGSNLLISGELITAGATLDQAHELAERANVQEVGHVPGIQIITRYWLGDLISCERHFAAWLGSFSRSFTSAIPAPSTKRLTPLLSAALTLRYRSSRCRPPARGADDCCCEPGQSIRGCERRVLCLATKTDLRDYQRASAQQRTHSS